MLRNGFLVPALLLTGMASNTAFAVTNTDSLTALDALEAASSTGIDTSWVANNNWTGLAQNLSTSSAVAWDLAGTRDPCGDNWYGLACDGSGNITHIEIPNAKMVGTLEQVFAALAPIKSQLVSVNLSGTTDDKNTLSGGIPATADGQGYSSLVYLALNNVGADGGIPDLSSYTSLVLANLYDNDFNTYTGPIGGASLSNLTLYDNPNLTGDLASTFAAATGLSVLRSENTLLTGGLELVTNIELEGADNKAMEVSWAPATGGLAAASHLVEYTNNNGASWTALPVVTSGSTATTGTLANGTYGVKVTPKASAGASGTASYAATALVISDSGSSAGTGSGSGNETGGGNSNGSGSGSGDSGGGGGAVFWLLGLALLFGFRRRKARTQLSF